MRKPALLLFAGFLMELIWAAGVVALQQHVYWLAFLAAALAPYVAAAASAWTVVDEPCWSKRLVNISWYAGGAVLGLAAVLVWR